MIVASRGMSDEPSFCPFCFLYSSHVICNAKGYEY